MYFGDMYYDEMWDYMSKDYLVVIRQPKAKGPTVWTGPNADTKTYKDMEGWRRIKDSIEKKLELITKVKPSWLRDQNAFKVALTEAQVKEVKMWTDVRNVIEFTK